MYLCNLLRKYPNPPSCLRFVMSLGTFFGVTRSSSVSPAAMMPAANRYDIKSEPGGVSCGSQ